LNGAPNKALKPTIPLLAGPRLSYALGVTVMADIQPTPVGFFGAIRLCWLLLTNPKRFLAVQDRDNQARNHYTDRVEREPSVYIVRRAFFYSLLLIIA
jgi:hypothetical protein